MTFTEAFTAYPWFLLGCALLRGALVGSFLNVVIHRLPIMLERQWRDQATETLSADPNPEPIAAVPAEPADAQIAPESVQAEPTAFQAEPEVVQTEPAAAETTATERSAVASSITG